MGQGNPLHLVVGAILLVLVTRSSLISPGSSASSSPQTSLKTGNSSLPHLELGTNSIVYNVYSYLSDDETGDVDNSTCAYAIMNQYRCSEPDCEDLVAGKSSACFNFFFVWFL